MGRTKGWGARAQDGADDTRSHDAAQSDVKFKTYELFISGIFHLTLS